MGEVNAVDHFEDQFLGEGHEPLGLPFDEEANFFIPRKSMMAKSLRLRIRPKSRFTRTIRYACICAKWAPFRC